MRLLYTADLHYTLKQFDWVAAHAHEFGAVLIGGDLLDLAGRLDLDVQIAVVEKYLARISADAPVLVTSGNHDGDHHTPAGESAAAWLHQVKSPRVFVDGDSVELGGTTFTLCPWWDGPESRAELERQLARAASPRPARWVWIHHAPPDRSPVSWTGKRFGGDEFLVEWIGRHSPDLVLSGHIHNAPFLEGGSWIDRIGATWVFNPGRQIGPSPTCLTLDLDTLDAEWVSFNGVDVRRLGAAGPGPVSAATGAAGAA
ncbi:MAG: metallophosphoesterase [Limisphaerales bacterium]